MEFRKLISFGKTSFVMSLPKAWVVKNNLKKGDLIGIEEHKDCLTLYSDTNKKETPLESIHFDVAGMIPLKMIKRTIASFYKGGYDEMKISFLTNEELKSIQDVIRETCIGFEIVEQGKNHILARKISDTIYDEFDTVLRRIFLFLKSLANDGLDALKSKDHNALSNVILIDDNINKFADFCRRVLNKKGHPKFRKIPPAYYIVEELEKVGDEYKNICKYVIKKNPKLNNDLLKLYGEVNVFLNLFYDLFYKFQISKLKAFGLKKEELEKSLTTLFKKAQKEDLELLLHLRTIIDKIFDMNGALIAAINFEN